MISGDLICCMYGVCLPTLLWNKSLTKLCPLMIRQHTDDKATQIQKVVPICSLLGDGDPLNIVCLPFSQLDIREE